VQLHTQDETFKLLYRLSYPTFLALLDLVRPHLERDARHAEIRGSEAILPEVQLAVALFFFAGGTYTAAYAHYGMARSTFYAAMYRTARAIIATSDLRLPGMPLTDAACQAVAHGFRSRSADGVFAHCVGCVVRTSGNDGSTYF
jgi:hypothetical protein